jgi:hypothetical protein
MLRLLAQTSCKIFSGLYNTQYAIRTDTLHRLVQAFVQVAFLYHCERLQYFVNALLYLALEVNFLALKIQTKQFHPIPKIQKTWRMQVNWLWRTVKKTEFVCQLVHGPKKTITTQEKSSIK